MYLKSLPNPFKYSYKRGSFFSYRNQVTDLKINLSDFYLHIRPCSFDLLTVTFQDKFFWTINDHRGPLYQIGKE